jgi:hypothetical protein
MKKSMLILAACTCVAGAIMTSCNSSATKVDAARENVVQANQDLDQANKEYLADVENYKKETAARIASNDQTISDLKAGMAHEKRAVKAAYKKKVEELEQKNAEMKLKMEAYKAEGKDKWQTFKTEFSHDMDELGKAFKDLTVKNVK